MAEELLIPGPCTVYWQVSAASTSSLALLGRWDNDAEAAWNEEMLYRNVTTNTTGETPEESILRGITGRLKFVLTKVDEAQVLAMKKATNRNTGTAGWRYPLVGGLQVGTIASPTGGLVDIQFRPTIASRPQFLFKYCRLMAIDLTPFGNQPLLTGFSMQLMRPSDATEATEYIIRTTS